ncbi:MAG TPA: ABC transporter permease [Blastocatellia bacterium]
MLNDLRYAVRILVKRPLITFITVLTLTLGIGANTAIFSVINTLLLSSLPFQDADRLVVIWSSNPQRDQLRFGVSLQDFEDWKKATRAFENLSAFSSKSANLTGGAEPEKIQFALVSANIFSTLRAQPALGRTFLPDEDKPGKDQVVILSHAFWQSYLAGDREAVGRTLQLDGKSVTVIGVMPPEFEFPSSTIQMWKPLGMNPDDSGPRGARWTEVIGRLADGATLEQAQAEMNAIAAELEGQYPKTNTGWQTLIEPFQETIVGDSRPALLILWGAVSLVLLVACANVTSLLLARAASREKEMAIRAALGASRGRIIRQLLSETLLLALAGGASGLVLAVWGINLLKAAAAGAIPRAHTLHLEGRVLIYTLGVSLLTGFICGLIPARKASRVDLNRSLKEGGKTSSAGERRRTLGALVIAEIALAVVVLVGAGLLIRSFARLSNIDPGFDPKNLLTMRVAPPWKASPEGKDQHEFFRQVMAERAQATVFYRQLISRIESIAGVRSAAAINRLPLTGNWWLEGFVREDRQGEDSRLECNGRAITESYFETMSIPILRGRMFATQDDERATPVAIIDRTAADRYWPGEDPIGTRISFDGGRSWFTIVGIAGALRHNRIEVEPTPLVYVPFAQARSGFFGDWGMTVVVREDGDAQGLAARVRAEVQSLNSELPVFDMRQMNEVIALNLEERRFNMLLFGIFAATALLLAITGIYGVISYSVTERRQELGVRQALGANSGDIIALVLKQGLRLIATGLITGIAAALGIAPVMSSLVEGISTTDPLTMAAVAMVVVAVSLVACYIPARRATRVDPMIALRAE